MRSFSIVVAADEAGGIGKDGRLPWRLPGDMAYFKRLTTEVPTAGQRNAVIMGRKTWESIPPRFRPLTDRLNIVITSNPALELPADVIRAESFEAALKRVATVNGLARVFVIGGAQVYRQALTNPGLASIYLTRVHGKFDSDATFGPIPDRFDLISRSQLHSDAGLTYDFEVHE